MAETESPDINCVYVDTNLDTHLLIPVDNNETVSDFKEKLCKEHRHCFPKLGEIIISAVKVHRQNTLGLLLDYHLPDFMRLSMAFEGVSNNCWFVSVDASVSVVDKCELMDADALLEKSKEIASDSLVLDGYNKNQTLEQDLGTQVSEKTSRKRKMRSPDAGKSGKKPSVDPNHEKNKEIATDSLLLDGYTKNQTPEEDLETPVVEKTRKKRKLKALDGEISQKKALVDVSQSADAVATTVDGSHELCGNVASESSPREELDDIATGKEIEMGEKSVEDLEGDKTEKNDLVSQPANLLDTNSGLTTRPDTEKKKRRKKRSEDDINQSSGAATVSEINGLPANVEATPEFLPISRGNPLVEASQKENDLAENSVDDVARDKTEADDLASDAAIHLDSNNQEKETKKSSNDDINQSPSAAAAATIITSRDIVDQINEVPANVDPVDTSPESLPISRGENLDVHFAEASQKDTEMVEKSVEDVGRDNTETDNIASRPEDHLDTNSGLTTRPDTEKKKKRKKRSKDDINGVPSASAAITTSRDIVNEINGVPANVEPVDATPASPPMSRGNFAESSQKGNEMVEKIDDDVGSVKAIPSAEDNIQTNNVEVDDADGAKSAKPTKKRKSKKAKTLTEEDTPVASGAQNVEAIEAVDGEGTDNVIRNVLDSLQEKNETEGNLERTGKKSSKKSKKKHSSKVAVSQVLSVEVNNAALEETPLTKNPKDADAFSTPIKNDAETDASLLKKSSEIAEDNNLTKKIPAEKIDMGDNFGCGPNQEKQNQVAGGAKSKKKEKKKGTDLHPSGSIAGSVNSVKPKEKKSRGQQPASSGASHLKSMVKSGRSGSVKATVSSKKQDVKKSSKPVAVENKRKTNFFENAEKCNSSEDEYKNKTCDDVSTRTPSDYSSDNDSDVTSMSRKQQGNNRSGGTNKFEGSLQDLLRRSSSYKKALIRAQSQPDIDDETPVDCVPDSQGV